MKLYQILSHELTLRVVSAAILMPFVAVMVWLGGWFYALSVVAFTGLIYSEWVGMVRRDRENAVILIFLGGFYFLPFLIGMLSLRLLEEDGILLLLIMMAAVWSSDIFAYFVGKAVQGPKIVPWISPHKTWAGFIAALVFPAILCAALLPLVDIKVVFGVLIGFFLGLACQIGDFLISIVKRHVGVKDTGRMVPGHGGLLDRMDSLVLAVPVFALLIEVARL